MLVTLAFWVGCPWSKQQFFSNVAKNVSDISKIQMAIGAKISDPSNQDYSERREYLDG